MELEEKLGGHIFMPDLNPENYSRILSAFYAAYRELEEALRKTGFVGELLLHRSKVHWIQEDLHFTVNLFGGKLTKFPTVNSFPAPISKGYALGVLYVMEGATLGGKYISHQLGKYDWISVEQNLNFFRSYGDRRAEMWKEFTNIVEIYAEDHPVESQDVLDGAEATFRYMDAVISQL